MASSGVVSTEQQPANAATVQSDVEAVEAALRGLWDRTRKAGELIAEVRGENASLRAQLDGLRKDLEGLRHELVRKDEALARLQAQRAGEEAQRGAALAEADRDVLAARVRDLIAKLDAYL
jgi:septal ring factor EnvC (AmiA/AmiB activator)